MESIETIYDTLWEESTKKFKDNKFELDYYLNNREEDNRRGITASPSCIRVQGFPIDNRLRLLRQQLRDNFRNSTLEHSIDKRYTLETAHSTVIRFKNPIINNSIFIDCLNKYRDYNFGVSEIDNIEFVYNDWYMNNSIVSTIKTFVL